MVNMDSNTQDQRSDEECLLKDHQSDDEQPPPTASRGHKYRWTVVIPLMVFYIIAGVPLMSIRSQYMYKKVQEYMNITLESTGTNSTQSCKVNDSDPNYILQQRVQAEAANWNMYISLAHFLPSLIMTVFYGTYSDNLGRRITFILPPIGSMLSTLVDMAMLTFDLPIQFFFLEVIEYMFGGMYTMFMGAFAYIADTSAPEERAMRMTILDALFLIAASVGELFVGYWIRAQGFLPPLYFVMIGKIVTLIYAIFFIPETIGRKKTKETATRSSSSKAPSTSSSSRFSLQDVKQGFLLYLTDNGSGRRWKLNILLASYFIANIVTTYRIMTLYEMNSPLCWDSVFIGYFGSASMAVRCVATLVGAFILRRKLSEAWIAVISRTQSVAESVYTAFVSTSTMMFFVPLLGSLSFLATPMTRAIMSKLVDQREQGSMFAVMTCAANVASLVSTLSVNKIYASTLLFMEGFIFLIGAVFGFISLLCVLFFIWQTGREEKKKPTDGPSNVRA